MTVNYSYDALNRMVSKTYSGGAYTPPAYYCYDGGYNAAESAICQGAPAPSYAVGRLTEVSNSNSVTKNTTFDALGRVTAHSQTTNGSTYSLGYTYNLAGDLIKESYPSGRVVSTGYDPANRVTSVAGTYGSSSTTYAGSFTYAPHGEAWNYVMGNGVAHAPLYNGRLQVCGLQEVLAEGGWSIPAAPSAGTGACPNSGVSGGSPLLSASLSWGASTNNGNLMGSTFVHTGGNLLGPQTFSQSYGYDNVNRLTGASDTGGWSRSMAYDAFGNMTPSGNPTPPVESFNANNQIVGLNYDAAGNQLSVNGNTLTYDADGRQLTVVGTGVNETYFYDGDGRRVMKTSSGGPTSVFVYDAGGRMAAEYSSVATTPACLTCYMSGDHLGTARIVTDQSGNVVARHDYLPFGEEVAADTFGRGPQWGPGNDLINQKFTGKERDSESGLDYFGARYYGSSLGRFTSPDPLLNSGHPDDPQSWNRYTYALNNPLAITDPTGLYNLVNNCGSDDKKCNKDFNTNAKNLRNAISALTKAVNGLKDGDQKTALTASLNALGTENDGNNVNVQFGKTSDNSAAQTVPGADSAGNINFTITFDPSKNQGLNNEAVNAAHEGTHVADISDPRFADPATTLSPFSLEYRGYRTSAYAAAALGESSWSFKGQNGKGSYPIWNGSWGAVDKNITNYVTTFRDKNGQPDHPETTPHDPWNK